MSQLEEYKGYKIVGDGTFGYKHVKPVGKGSVPASLKGAFTTVVFAQKAIDAVVAAKSK